MDEMGDDEVASARNYGMSLHKMYQTLYYASISLFLLFRACQQLSVSKVRT